MFAAMRLLKDIKLTTGARVALSDVDDGCIGMIPVYDSPKAARASYGADVEILELYSQQKKPS